MSSLCLHYGLICRVSGGWRQLFWLSHVQSNRGANYCRPHDRDTDSTTHDSGANNGRADSNANHCRAHNCDTNSNTDHSNADYCSSDCSPDHGHAKHRCTHHVADDCDTNGAPDYGRSYHATPHRNSHNGGTHDSGSDCSPDHGHSQHCCAHDIDVADDCVTNAAPDHSRSYHARPNGNSLNGGTHHVHGQTNSGSDNCGTDHGGSDISTNGCADLLLQPTAELCILCRDQHLRFLPLDIHTHWLRMCCQSDRG
jgi:hypothetical protein